MIDVINIASELVFKVILPAIVTYYTSKGINSGIKFLNEKQDLVKVQLTKEQEKFIEKKIIEGIYSAQNKDFKNWANKEIKEFKANEKLDHAKNYVFNEISNLVNKPIIQDIENKIESKLAEPQFKIEMEEHFNKLKDDFLNKQVNKNFLSY